jgi:anti-sigma regulatory factor (Ser/Thr protein kinase)
MIIYEGEIKSTFQDVDEAVKKIDGLMRQKFEFISSRLLFNIDFMLREILNNAVEHGNHFDEHKKVKCRVSYDVPKLEFIVKDEGKGFSTTDFHTESHDPRMLLRDRHRGHETILEMDFDVNIEGNQVTVSMNLNQEEKSWKINY